ncbi:MAG: serine/threonine-protein kinase [Blautia sp.]|nr:serine/threonine-protein kinase [Blautia sp.]
MDRELPVSVWPEWKIVEKIGEGSFGKVYKAQRTEKGRSFYSAIKVITIPGSKSELNSVRAETNDDNATRDYFENLVEECIQEVSTMGYFRGNSHIVSVEDYKVIEYLDEIGWEISIRMEYLTSFTDYCTGKNLTEREVLKLGIDLCRALEYCGQLNIIHRDIKPENIFVSRFGDFKLGDFGIARELERSMSSMSKKGTFSYMAPEMYRGEAYDRRADIYSLGLVLFKLMNHNRLPFLNLEKQLITYRDKENALARRMSGEAVPKPAQAGEAFGEIIRKACAYWPQERYQTPEEMRKELQDLYEGRHLEVQKKTSMQTAEIPSGKQPVPEEKISVEKPAVVQTKQIEQQMPEKRYSAPLKRRRKRKKPVIPPQAIVISVVLLLILLFAGIYLKQFLEDTVRRQTMEMIEAMEANVPKEISKDAPSFMESVETIKERATEIVNNLESYRVEGEEGKKLLYYNDEGQLMKALIYPEVSAEGVYEEYYYWNEQMFFAYIWLDKEAELYYYQDGNLIRWIDSGGACHDNETDNSEYNERGDRYWSNSVQQLD